MMWMECIELLADYFPILVPLMAFCGLIAAQSAHISSVRNIAVSVFYGSLVVVALGTVRSMMNSDGAWLIHTGSLGLLVIGSSVIMISTASQKLAD